MKHPRIDLGDGHYCYSGPECSRHGARIAQLAAERETIISEAQAQEQVKTPALNARTTYTLPVNRISEAITSVDKANLRLARYPEIEDRYSYTLSEPRIVGEGTHTYMVQDFSLNKPVLKVNGWAFAAAHEFTANGDVTTFVADQDVVEELGGKPVDNHCDHCGSKRARERVYWLKNKSGEFKQVGSTCLKGFLGISPQGLWALESDLNLSSLGGGFSSESRVYDREQLLSAALVASNNGEDFVTKSQAYGTHRPTSTAVLEDWEAYSAAEFSPERFEKVRSILNWLDSTSDEPGSYLGNLKSALGSGQWVKPKHINLAVSAITAHSRHIQREEQNAARAAAAARQKKDFLPAEIDSQIKGLRLKVTKSQHFPNGFGGITMLIMEDEEGHVIKWNSSGASYGEGDEVLVKSARIKAKEKYVDRFENEHYQTVLKNARTEKV